jgi:hypothetical protein
MWKVVADVRTFVYEVLISDVCMYVYMYIYMHIYIHTYKYIIHTYIHTYMHTYKHAHTHARTHAHTHAHTHTDIHQQQHGETVLFYALLLDDEGSQEESSKHAAWIKTLIDAGANVNARAQVCYIDSCIHAYKHIYMYIYIYTYAWIEAFSGIFRNMLYICPHAHTCILKMCDLLS